MRDELTAQLVCYLQSVAGVQWDRMQAGTLGEDLNRPRSPLNPYASR